MPFETANIDRAIIMTQYDLRGFLSPLGIRFKKMSSEKSFWSTIINFMAFTIGLGHQKPTDTYANPSICTFKEYLEMCEKLKSVCNESQKEAIQLLLQEILEQSKEMKEEVVAKKRKISPYLQPFQKKFDSSKALIALGQTFEVPIPKEKKAYLKIWKEACSKE